MERESKTEKGKVTFVIPGVNRSGGIRVTVAMAERLRLLGYEARIIYPAQPVFSRKWLRESLQKCRSRVQGLTHTDWLFQFHGKVEKYTDIRDLYFASREIVIAVGTFTVMDVNKLDRNVIKIRYNHGFTPGVEELTRTAWGLPMTTITVSNTLVPRLEELSGGAVSAVIPNGLDQNEYFTDPEIRRDGIGTLYSSHVSKAPEDIISLMRRMKSNLPDIPQYFFGAEPKPRDLNFGSYSMFPSVDDARKIYNSSLVWVSCSRTEGLPAPLLEAMACGCVVVSASNLGARELIRNGENGFLVPVGNIDAFAEKISELLINAELRRSIVQQGYETVNRFNWDESVKRMHAFLQSL